MPWYVIAVLLCLALGASFALVFVVIKTSFRVGSLEVSRHEMQEGAVRRDAVAVQVGRVLGLRSAKAALIRRQEHELRAAAYAKQEKEKETPWEEMHEYAASSLAEVLQHVQDDLFAAGDRDDACKNCQGRFPGQTRDNVVSLCDYCTVNKEKRPKK